MAWSRTTWVDDDGSLTVGTAYTAARMNNIEIGIEENQAALAAEKSSREGGDGASHVLAESLFKTEKEGREFADVELSQKPATEHDKTSFPTAGTGNLTWTHTPVAEFVQGVLVGVVQNYVSKAAFGVSKVTYGGKEMKRVMLQEEASLATQAWYYLPTSQIPQGAQTVVVTVANAEAKRQAFCATVTADGPVRPIFLTAAAPSASLAARDLTETLEQGAYYGMLSATKTPTIAGSITQSVFNENLGTTEKPMFAAFSRSNSPHPGKGEASGERPEVKWNLAEKGAYGTAIALMGLVKDWGEVTALPTRPGLGDTCEFVADATNNVIWELKYDNRNATYPWAKVGGLGIRNTQATTRETTSSTPQTTGAPTLTAPLKMEAEFRVGVENAITTSGEHEARMLLFINNVETSGVNAYVSRASVAVVASKRTTIAASQTAVGRYKSDGVGNASFFGMYVEIDPIRVG